MSLFRLDPWRISILVLLTFIILGYDISRLYPLLPRFDINRSACTSPIPDVSGSDTKSRPNPHTTSRLENHTYHPNGLLELNPLAPHPIYELISNAEKEWSEKLSRASKTLREAVVEYKRRYGRDPPRGFDKWWDYVQLHSIPLPDSYDLIHHDLEPFWGISPKELQQLQAMLESEKDSYTIGKNAQTGGKVEVVATSFYEGHEGLIGNSEGLMEMLKKIEESLPEFRATVSPHDNPAHIITHEGKQAFIDAARQKKTLPLNDAPGESEQRGPWSITCPPSSPARSSGVTESKNKTFIYDHHLAMDSCNHPSHFSTHGQYLSSGDQVTAYNYPLPFFTSSSTYGSFHQIRWPIPYLWVDDIDPSQNPEWDDREDDRMNWRGRNTGLWHAEGGEWWECHRIRAIRQLNNLTGSLEVLIPPSLSQTNHASNDTPLLNDLRNTTIGHGAWVPKAILNPTLMDVKFVGEPLACEESVCEKMKDEFEFGVFQDGRKAGKYRFSFDIDGNGWSGRFKRLVTTNSLVLKTTIYPEWFTERIQPWVHFVPVKVDLEDLWDVMAFFRGDLFNSLTHNAEGDRQGRSKPHPNMLLAKKIAEQGREWSLKYWREEDMTAYLWRLMLEYARVMSDERDSEHMSFRLD